MDINFSKLSNNIVCKINYPQTLGQVYSVGARKPVTFYIQPNAYNLSIDTVKLRDLNFVYLGKLAEWLLKRAVASLYKGNSK